MAKRLTFGAPVIQNAPWPTMVERAKHLESLGIDTIWVADHFVNPFTPSQPWFEAWTTLAGLAHETRRARLGTLITSTAFRNPAFLARQALTVDHLSNGRLELGLGSGVAADPSNSMVGIDDWSPRERVGRFQETVQIVDALLRQEVTTFEGRYYRVRDAVVNPRPVQQPRPPLTIAALGPRMIQIAARYADTWSTWSGRGVGPEQVFDIIREKVDRLDRACEEIGRDPASITCSLLTLGLGTSPLASVDAFQDLVGRYRELGFSDFVLYYPPDEWYPPTGGSQQEVFERVMTDVVPKLRGDRT